LNAEGMHRVIGVIDNMIGDSIPPKAAGLHQDLREARAIYRNLLALDKPGVLSADGQIMPGRAYRSLHQMFPEEMGKGKLNTAYGGTIAGGEGSKLMDAVRISQTFKDVVADSGTATRLSLQGLLSNPKETLVQGALMRGAGALYMNRGGALGMALGSAANAAPRAAAGGALAIGRGPSGLMGDRQR